MMPAAWLVYVKWIAPSSCKGLSSGRYRVSSCAMCECQEQTNQSVRKSGDGVGEREGVAPVELVRCFMRMPVSRVIVCRDRGGGTGAGHSHTSIQVSHVNLIRDVAFLCALTLTERIPLRSRALSIAMRLWQSMGITYVKTRQSTSANKIEAKQTAERTMINTKIMKPPNNDRKIERRELVSSPKIHHCPPGLKS